MNNNDMNNMNSNAITQAAIAGDINKLMGLLEYIAANESRQDVTKAVIQVLNVENDISIRMLVSGVLIGLLAKR